MIKAAKIRLNTTSGMNVPRVNIAVALTEFQKVGEVNKYVYCLIPTNFGGLSERRSFLKRLV